MTAPRSPLSNTSTSSQITAEQIAPKLHACVLCTQRKVKCDRRPSGCMNCAKARVPCIYKAPPPPRRRKKGERDININTRLSLYEAALRNCGVDPEELVRQGCSKDLSDQKVFGIDDFYQGNALDTPYPDTKSELGVLITEEGKSRYLENGIWTSLRSEFRDPKEILEESSDEDSAERYDVSSSQHAQDTTGFLFGSPISPAALQLLHPDPVQIFKIWQSYLDNINPLVKIFHAPTIQQLICDVSGDLNCIPRNVEALLFSIYCITVESLTDNDCLAMLGQSKPTALQRFRLGAQHSMINANLLKTSDLMVLQAFTLFLLSLQRFDARVTWIWSGIAHRIAIRIGLHRDGTMLGLPPFEIEMRRRVWWQIMLLEGYTQKLAGTGAGTGSIAMGDTNMPSNVNDSDLFQGMEEMPKRHEGATEMMFFLIRCHVGEFLKRSTSTQQTFDGVWNRLTTSTVHASTKDKAIDELETKFKNRFLDYCDPSITWHMMCIHLGKSIISMMRFMAHSTEHDKLNMSLSDKDYLFDLALEVSTAQNLSYTTKEMRGFMWHVNLHFQWKAFIYLLSELRYRTNNPKVEQAWKEIEISYGNHPSFDNEFARKALPMAVSNLTMKAWTAYAARNDVLEPKFIQLIRRRQECCENRSHNDSQYHDALSQTWSSTAIPVDDINPQKALDMTTRYNVTKLSTEADIPPAVPQIAPLDYPEEMDWAQWDNLFVEFQTNNTDETQLNLSDFNLGV